MNNTPRNPPAYPTGDHKGMDLRDAFALAAMQGDWAAQNEHIGEFENNLPDEVFEERAATYYRMADAMLAEREKKESLT